MFAGNAQFLPLEAHRGGGTYPMATLSILDAAALVQAAYGTGLRGVRRRYEGMGVRAALLQDGTLLLPGTDQASDWWRYNLPTARYLGKDKGFRSPAGEGLWFWGFLKFAQRLGSNMGTTRPSAIVGHSLGGAVAQILGVHFQVPVITFAAPKPCASAAALPGEGRVLNVIYPSDPVPRYPHRGDARHIGQRHMIGGPVARGFVHKVPDYVKYLRPDLAAGRLGDRWPRSTSSRRR